MDIGMTGLPGAHALLLVPTAPGREHGSATAHLTEALSATAAGKRQPTASWKTVQVKPKSKSHIQTYIPNYIYINHTRALGSWCQTLSLFSSWTLAFMEFLGKLQQELWRRHPAEAESLWRACLWWWTMPRWKGRAEAMQWEEMPWLVTSI